MLLFMKTSLCYFINFLIFLLPSTRFFKLKRKLWRLSGASISDGVCINQSVTVYSSGNISIGRDTWIGIGCRFYVPSKATVEIGACCDIAPQVTFHAGSHLISGSQRRAGKGIATSIFIGCGCWLGLNTTILAGVSLGDGCVVGAGSVVLAGSYPDNALICGIPARVIKILETNC